jgi:hypothetical protein
MAVLLALGLTVVGVFADIQRLGQLGLTFQACYFLGCLLAVSLVQRKGLFGPMVQPPLILAVAVPGVVMFAGSLPADAGTATTALAVGTPLINGFPTMAITTGLTVAAGVFRLYTQRSPAVPVTADEPPAPGRQTPARQAPTREGPARQAAARQRPARPAPGKMTPAASSSRPRPAPEDDEPITGPITRQRHY